MQVRSADQTTSGRVDAKRFIVSAASSGLSACFERSVAPLLPHAFACNRCSVGTLHEPFRHAFQWPFGTQNEASAVYTVRSHMSTFHVTVLKRPAFISFKYKKEPVQQPTSQQLPASKGAGGRGEALKFGAPLAEGLRAVMGYQPRKSFK